MNEGQFAKFAYASLQRVVLMIRAAPGEPQILISTHYLQYVI
jgi:hypothetical protein